MIEQYAIPLLVTFISLMTCSYAVIFHTAARMAARMEARMEADVWNRFVRLETLKSELRRYYG